MPLLGKRTRNQRPPVLPLGPPTSSPVRSSSIPPSSPPKTPIRKRAHSAAHGKGNENEHGDGNVSGNGLDLPAALLQNHDASPEIDAIVITSLSILPFCCHEDLCSMSKSQLVSVAERLNERLPRAMRIEVGEGYSRSNAEANVGPSTSPNASTERNDERERGSKRWIRKEIERIVDIKTTDSVSGATGSQAQALGPPFALALPLGRIPPSVSEPPLPLSLPLLASTLPPAAPKANRMRRESEVNANAHVQTLLQTEPRTPGTPRRHLHTPGCEAKTPRTPRTPIGASVGTSAATPVRCDFISSFGTCTFTPSQLGTPKLERLDEVDEGRGGSSDSDETRYSQSGDDDDEDEEDRPTKKRRISSVRAEAPWPTDQRPKPQLQRQRQRHPLAESMTRSNSSTLGLITSTSIATSIFSQDPDVHSCKPDSIFDPNSDSEDDEDEVERLVRSSPTPTSVPAQASKSLSTSTSISNATPPSRIPVFKKPKLSHVHIGQSTRTRFTRSKTVSVFGSNTMSNAMPGPSRRTARTSSFTGPSIARDYDEDM
ncbi:hypothetical protein D9758_002509 [Tetrapyrgos nigripes]|uniref:Uncharacterized protein n=1 Tax=Tetrapyrgos nigripes TaxID=182062 RepID=A0A8H5LU05_9AGAR|nr:hypothetical protein D9758_002509 [Tetrapyrgos nigripes]